MFISGSLYLSEVFTDPSEFAVWLNELGMNMRPCLSMETQPVSFFILGGGRRYPVFQLWIPLELGLSLYKCPGWLYAIRAKTHQMSQAVCWPQLYIPLHASSRYLLSIFFILISQGMKMTTKLQAKRANFRQSYTGEAMIRNLLILYLSNGVLGRGEDPIHTHRTLIMASQVISISKTKVALYFPCVLTRQYITVCPLCYEFCIPFWRQTLMNPRLASNSQYT